MFPSRLSHNQIRFMTRLNHIVRRSLSFASRLFAGVLLIAGAQYSRALAVEEATIADVIDEGFAED